MGSVDVKTTLRYGLGSALVALLCGCGPKPLPEAESPAAHTYVATCGGCHVIYRPEMFTAGMWRTVVDRMDREMTRRRRPMPGATKSVILDYLQRNAGER